MPGASQSSSLAHVDVAIMQPGYLPWIGYFDLVAMADTFVLYDDVQFDKGGWRNRNRIWGARGIPQWLTVPIVTAGKLAQPINETALTDDGSTARHLKSIRQVYRKAPYFDWCFPTLDRYLCGRRYQWLVDLCFEGHNAICTLLDLKTPVRLSSEIGFSGVGRTERLVSICRALGASRYIAADASKAYMDESLWDAAQISLVYQNYPHPQYNQFDQPFLSHLSVVDALMFLGPAVRSCIGISHPKMRDASSRHPQKIHVGFSA